MPYFESMMEVYQILCLLINPIICCTVYYLKKMKRFWILPISIMCIFLIISAIFFPYYFQDILTGEYDFTTVYWIMFFIPLQIISALFFTTTTYLLMKWKRKK